MKQLSRKIKVALADDHVLLCNALATLVNTFEGVEAIFTASNGREVIDNIGHQKVPDVLIMDLNMPEVDGNETARWLQKNCPAVKILVLTMYDSDVTLIRLLQSGVKGFLKKDIHPNELKFAILSVMENGYYYQQAVSSKLANIVFESDDKDLMKKNKLTDTEILFLKLSCSEMTYKEIAEEMNLSPRAVETLRDNLFMRLDFKSRVGSAIYAIRNGLVII